MRNKYLILTGVLATAACLAPTAVNAATFNFVDLANAQVTEQGYQPYVTSDDGITVTASGRSFNGASTYYAYLDKGIGSNAAGLGVCKVQFCSGSSDDNVTLNELLNLSFSEMVKITGITFRNGEHGTTFDGDAGYAVDDPTATTLLEFSAFDPEFPTALINRTGSSFQFIAGSTWQGVTTENDGRRLYISAITVEKIDDLSEVPEPGTIGLLGLGLVGLGLRFRRRW